jgi:hypothetical protein
MRTVTVAFFLLLVNLPANKPTNASGQTTSNCNNISSPPINVLCSPDTGKGEEKAENKTPAGNAASGINWETLPTWALVGVGLITFWAIWKQAKESAEATKAMQAQVAMQMETLRPRLIVGFDESQFKPMTEGHAARMVARVKNTGGVPAYRVVPESWIEFLPMPFEEFTQGAEYFKGESFPVYPTEKITYPVMRKQRLTDAEIKATFAGTHCLCLRLRFSYEALGKPKFSDFIFGAEPNGVATLKSDAD